MRSDPDDIAHVLTRVARTARAFPPAWDRGGISVPVMGPSGEGLGRALLGRGLYLDMDLRAVGITRSIPGVFERTPVQRYVDHLLRRGVDRTWAERGAITGLADIVRRRAQGFSQDVTSFIPSTIQFMHANIYTTTFLFNGGSYTAIPGGAAHNKDTAGSFSEGLTNPVGGNKKYLLSLGIGLTSISNLNISILADLLVGAGGINCNSNSPQTVNSVPLPRYTDGKGVFATFITTSTLGSTPATMTMTKYTNQDGTPNQASPAVSFVPSAIANELAPDRTNPIMQMAAGDYGIRSVEEVQLSAAMGASTCALDLYKPLAFIPMILNRSYEERDFNNHPDGLVELVTGSDGALGCLVLYFTGSSTQTSAMTFFMRTVEG